MLLDLSLVAVKVLAFVFADCARERWWMRKCGCCVPMITKTCSTRRRDILDVCSRAFNVCKIGYAKRTLIGSDKQANERSLRVRMHDVCSESLVGCKTTFTRFSPYVRSHLKGCKSETSGSESAAPDPASSAVVVVVGGGMEVVRATARKVRGSARRKRLPASGKVKKRKTCPPAS